MPMIQILCKKAFRFKHPGKSMLQVEQLVDGQTRQTESGQKFEDVYVEVRPNVLSAVPDWVKTDKIWEWGTKDGDILEVATKSPAVAEAQRKQEDEARATEEAVAEEQEEEKKANLGRMTKVELLKYASDKFELELSPALTKEGILSAIADAEKEDER